MIPAKGNSTLSAVWGFLLCLAAIGAVVGLGLGGLFAIPADPVLPRQPVFSCEFLSFEAPGQPRTESALLRCKDGQTVCYLIPKIGVGCVR